MLIEGTSAVRVLGGRIQGSGGVGIRAPHSTGIIGTNTSPVRVVGGSSYPIEASATSLRRLFESADGTHQDSLKGNARDTVIMLGGSLSASLNVRAGLPWHVWGDISVGAGGLLRARATSLMVFNPGVGITAHSGGRIELRGTSAAPVVLTADDPARGWEGITLDGTATTSIVSNTRVEHVAYLYTALAAQGGHPVAVDSSVFRQNGRALSLLTTGSRLSRTRVDTTLSAYGPAVELGANAILESTRVRGSSGAGVGILSATVQVQSCEVLGSVGDGIELSAAAPVHNCNLVGNGGVGVRNLAAALADATGNWWGDVGGPTAPGGDGVAGAVTYGPWLTAPYTLPYVP
jgi:hypothetical protein